MKRYIMYALIFIVLFRSAYAMTLKEAVEYSLANNPQIKRCENDIKATEAKIREVKSYAKPKANISALYMAMDEPPAAKLPNIHLNLGPINKIIVLPTLDLSRDFISTATINLSYPVYTGGKITSGINQAKLGKKAYQSIHTATQYEVAYGTIKAYLSLILLQELRTVSSEAYSAANFHLKQAQRLYEEKQIAKYEVIRAEAEVENTLKKFIDSENKCKIAQEVLKNIMGIDPGELSTEPIELSAEDEKIINQNSAEAINNSDAIKALKTREKIYMEGIEGAKSEKKPNAMLFASQKLYANQQPFSTPDFMGGIVVNIPVYDGGSADAKIMEHKAHIEKNKNDITKLENDIKLQIIQYGIEKENAMASLKASEKAIELASETLRIATRRFAEGVGTGLEITDANLALSAAKMSKAQAIYQYSTALFGMAKITNTLWEILDIKNSSYNEEK